MSLGGGEGGALSKFCEEEVLIYYLGGGDMGRGKGQGFFVIGARKVPMEAMLVDCLVFLFFVLFLCLTANL